MLIARYTSLVLARPGEAFPLDRLVELYRERDGNLDKLVAEFEARAAETPEPTSTRHSSVALGGVFGHDAQLDRAAAAYARAIALAPKNPVAMLALGRLLETAGDKGAAKRRYEEALPNVQVDADREQLLHSLIGLSLDVHDYDGAKRYAAKKSSAARRGRSLRARSSDASCTTAESTLVRRPNIARS